MTSAYGCAREVVAALVAGGVTEVVLAPGSRSAPLAYALWAAESAGDLRLHVRIDERTAGFLALGLAKASGRPVAVVTTSGTAVANLHPAMLEAAHAHLPLLAVTADRPRALAFSGANQTTDQVGMFASHVRAEAHVADTTGGAAWEVFRLLAAATGRRSRRPGPVHLDVSFTEPLTPDDSPAPAVAPAALVAAPPAPPTVLPAGPRTVVLAGDGPATVGVAARGLAERARLPLLAEPSSQARSGPAAIGLHRLLLATALGAQIQRVVVYGHPTLSRSVTRLLADPGVELVVVSPYADWPDPGRHAAQVVDAADLAPGEKDWLARWRRADGALRARLDALLSRSGVLTGPALTGPALAAALWAELGGDDILVVGSSSPIRDLDLAPVRADPPVVWANRGLSGIDGTVSTAAGIALGAGRPAHALLGDLTFLHDLTGLVIGPDEPRPDLRIVVANDDGGSIFATLEHGEPARAATYERLFGTPHGTDLAALAAATGCPYRRVETAAELPAALAEPPRGIELVEAVVDRSARRALTTEIDRLVAGL